MDMFTDSIVEEAFELEDNYIDISDYNSDKEIIANYGTVLKNKGKERIGYCCFNYALNNEKICWIENAVDILVDEYIEIKKLKDMKKGDILLFYDEIEAQHLAKVVETDGTIQGTKVRAKFGELGLYEHKLEDTPTLYGYKFIVFRKGLQNEKNNITNRKRN